MELSLLLAQNIFGLFLIIFVGYLTVKCRVLTPDDSKVISKVVLYIVCPCTILNSFQIDFIFYWSHCRSFDFHSINKIIRADFSFYACRKSNAYLF